MGVAEIAAQEMPLLLRYLPRPGLWFPLSGGVTPLWCSFGSKRKDYWAKEGFVVQRIRLLYPLHSH